MTLHKRYLAKHLLGIGLRGLRRWLLYASALWLAALSQPLFAAPSCSFNSASAVSFGNYNVFDALPNNNGVGSIRIRCVGGGGPTFVVTLSTGQSNSYAMRFMNSGVNRLNYNLYTSTARSVIWGNGSGGSSVMSVSRNATTTLSIFGQIPAGQDASVGVYSDSIVTTVNF